MSMKKVPFISFTAIHTPLEKEMAKVFAETYQSGSFILGERVADFEQEYASFNGTNFCIGISSGLDALILCLKALDIGPGDEVIVPSNTFIATCLAVTHVGAQIVFAEPDADSFNLHPENIKPVISSKTKAIIPVHLYGRPCEMNSIMEISTDHNLYVIEDNAQAQGATYHGIQTGSFGHMSATSFYPGKNLGALGDAGAVTTNDASLADKVRALRNYGSTEKYVHEMTGYNMRLDALQAGFLSVKLKHLSNWNNERRQLAKRYIFLLTGTGDLILPLDIAGVESVYHLFVIRTRKRDKLRGYLEEHNIGTLIHYPIPPHLQKAYAYLGLRPGSLPIAEEMARTVLSLPLYPGLKEEDQEYIADVIKRFYDKA
jgi:dTDP-4-amino-4,6-dideoxygalactose transaminase